MTGYPLKKSAFRPFSMIKTFEEKEAFLPGFLRFLEKISAGIVFALGRAFPSRVLKTEA
jgi:hypothetical protein